MSQNVNIELVIQAGKSAQTLGEIKQSVKDVTEALKNVKTGTEEFERLKEVFQRNRANVKAMRQEFSDLKQIEGTAKILTGSFAAASASLSLFTGESEKAEKAIRQVEGAFVLMESVQKIARAFREAAIANETFNKSLLTNPYMLIATAIAGIAVALYTFSNNTEEAEKKVKELNEQQLTNLKNEFKDLDDEQEKSIKAIQHEIDLLKTRKATSDEIHAAEMKKAEEEKKNAQEHLAHLTDSEKKDIEIYKESIARRQDLIDNMEKERQLIQEKEALQYNATKYDKELIEIAQRHLETDQKEIDKLDERVKKGKELFELQEKYKDKGEDADKSKDLIIATQLEEKREEQLQKNHEAELARIKAVLDAKQKREEQDAYYLELEKEAGLTEKQLSDNKISYLKSQLNDDKEDLSFQEKKLKSMQDQLQHLKKGTLEEKAVQENIKAEKELVDGLNKSLDEKNKKLTIESTINKRLTEESNQKKQLQSIEELDKAYEKEAAALKNITDIMRAKGANDYDVYAKEIQYNNQLVSTLRSEITTVQDSILKDEEKKKKVEELQKKIQELTNANNVLAASMKKIDGDSVFGKYTKEVKKSITETERLVPVVNKVMNLATQIVSQNVQARIALYQHENDMYVAGLNQALNEGFITQQQFNQKKAAADAELKKKKREEEHKEFVAKKATGIIQATIQTALSVMQALSNTPPPASYAMAAVAGALGAVEIATIASQKEPPAYAMGGSVIGEGTSTSDSITAKLSNGESVINARSTKAFAPLLSAINQLGGGVALKGTQPINKTPTGVVQNNQPASSSGQIHKVYVTESDITKTQKKISIIKSRTTF